MDDVLATEYHITPNKAVTMITTVVIGMFVAFATIIPYVMYQDNAGVRESLFVLILMLAIYAPTTFFTWGFAPKKYILGNDGVQIVRHFKPITIPIASITNVEDRSEEKLWRFKKVGNQGLFAFTGSFYSKKDGTFYMYAKNSNLVMIYADKKYVVSPDEKDLFIDQLHSYLK